MSKICLVSSGRLRECSPRTTFRPLGLKTTRSDENTHVCFRVNGAEHKHLVQPKVQQKKSLSPRRQAVNRRHHPLIRHHKPSTLVFQALAFGHLYGRHVGPGMRRRLSAANDGLTWKPKQKVYKHTRTRTRTQKGGRAGGGSAHCGRRRRGETRQPPRQRNASAAWWCRFGSASPATAAF